MIINILATIGGIVVAILSLIALYLLGGVLLISIGNLLNMIRKKIFYWGGGEANTEEHHYKPPRPPWDRLRYEVERIRHFVYRVQVIYGVRRNVGWGLNGVEKIYKQREEYYGNNE